MPHSSSAGKNSIPANAVCRLLFKCHRSRATQHHPVNCGHPLMNTLPSLLINCSHSPIQYVHTPHSMYISHTVCTYLTQNVQISHRMYISHTVCTYLTQYVHIPHSMYISHTVCTYLTQYVHISHSVYISHTVCTYLTQYVHISYSMYNYTYLSH